MERRPQLLAAAGGLLVEVRGSMQLQSEVMKDVFALHRDKTSTNRMIFILKGTDGDYKTRLSRSCAGRGYISQSSETLAAVLPS